MTDASPTDSNADRPGRLVVISGASGSGKSTLVDRVLARPGRRLARSISATTRDPRAGETPDVSYLFLARADFESRRDRGEFLEWAEVHGNLYGTPLPAVNRALQGGTCVFLVIDVQGGLQVLEKVPDALLIFIQTPDFETLEARLRARGTDDEPTILKRLANARREIALSERYHHQVVNDDLDHAVEELLAILNSSRCGG